jgi:small redox-active disulfide protein 2
MKIKVLGPGCRNCEVLHETVLKAVEELGRTDITVEYIKDTQEITKYIMATPGIVIDETVTHEGKPLPSVGQIKAMICHGETSGGGCECSCGC